MTGKCVDCQSGIIVFASDKIYGTLVVCKDGWVKRFMDDDSPVTGCDRYELRGSYKDGIHCRFCESFRDGKCGKKVPYFMREGMVPTCTEFRRNGHRKETEK